MPKEMRLNSDGKFVDFQDVFNKVKNYIFTLMGDLDARNGAENECVEQVISKQ
jgi:hypothetical protein